jgi:transposase
LFINRRRDRIKILYWENGGFALWYKRLEAGTFEAVTWSDDQSVVTIDATELAMLISGVSLQSVKRRKRFRNRDAPTGGGGASREKKVAL